MAWYRIAGEQELREGVYYEFDDRNKIGEGGMGTVYLGRRIDSFGNETKVAIKKISSGIDPLSSEMARARREASIQIRHENLLYMFGMVTTFHKDMLGSSIEENFIVMEYLDGIELVDFIDGHLASRNNIVSEKIKALYARYINDRFSVSKEIIRSVLSALSALHDAGYIHRDVDPRNVFITVDGNVKLIDFGLCKPLFNVSDVYNLSQANLHKQLSTNGQIMGKPSYSPPELLYGKLDKQDRTTDIYSTGLLYYHLVTGKVPYEEEGNLNNIIEAQNSKKLSLSCIEDKRTAAIIAKAIEKKNNRRFQTCAGFRAALDEGKISVSNVPLIIIASFAAISVIAAITALFITLAKKPDPQEEIVVQPTLSDLCDVLVSRVSSGEIVDSMLVSSIKDSISMKESNATLVWDKLTDRSLYMESGSLVLYCDYRNNPANNKRTMNFRIYDFDSPNEIQKLFSEEINNFGNMLRGLPFEISTLDTLYTPQKELLPKLLTEIFLDDMSEYPRKYGEDKFLFLFFSRFDLMEKQIKTDAQAKEWFTLMNKAIVTSELNHWDRANKLQVSSRYKKAIKTAL